MSSEYSKIIFGCSLTLQHLRTAHTDKNLMNSRCAFEFLIEEVLQIMQKMHNNLQYAKQKS